MSTRKPLPAVPPKRGSQAGLQTSLAPSSPSVDLPGSETLPPPPKPPDSTVSTVSPQVTDNDFLRGFSEHIIPYEELELGQTLGEGAFGRVVKVGYAGYFYAAKMLKVQADEMDPEVRDLKTITRS